MLSKHFMTKAFIILGRIILVVSHTPLFTILVPYLTGEKQNAVGQSPALYTQNKHTPHTLESQSIHK